MRDRISHNASRVLILLGYSMYFSELRGGVLCLRGYTVLPEKLTSFVVRKPDREISCARALYAYVKVRVSDSMCHPL